MHASVQLRRPPTAVQCACCPWACRLTGRHCCKGALLLVPLKAPGQPAMTGSCDWLTAVQHACCLLACRLIWRRGATSLRRAMPSPWTRCSIRHATWASPLALLMHQAYEAVCTYQLVSGAMAANAQGCGCGLLSRPACPTCHAEALLLCLVDLSSLPGASSVGLVGSHTCLPRALSGGAAGPTLSGAVSTRIDQTDGIVACFCIDPLPCCIAGGPAVAAPAAAPGRGRSTGRVPVLDAGGHAGPGPPPEGLDSLSGCCRA